MVKWNVIHVFNTFTTTYIKTVMVKIEMIKLNKITGMICVMIVWENGLIIPYSMKLNFSFFLILDHLSRHVVLQDCESCNQLSNPKSLLCFQHVLIFSTAHDSLYNDIVIAFFKTLFWFLCYKTNDNYVK